MALRSLLLKRSIVVFVLSLVVSPGIFAFRLALDFVFLNSLEGHFCLPCVLYVPHI